MLLGKIFGKVTTKEFKFLAEAEVRKFEYVQVYHEVYEYVLCQVVELEKQENMTTALCQIIGFKDKDAKIKKLRIPFEPGSEVLSAEDDFISSIIKLENTQTGAYLGKLEGRDIPVQLDLKKLLTKHVAVLAKSGSGKSYSVGVLLEEIIDKKVPLLIIDPHGEYSSMNLPNDNEEEKKLMATFGVTPQGFKINEYGDTTVNPKVRPLRLPNNLSSQELVDMLPVRLSASQLGLLYSATQDMSACDFDSVIYSLQQEESNAKWNVIKVIEQLNNIGLFSSAPTPYHELVKSGSCSIVNFKGIDPDIQDIIVYKLTKDLFELRKQNKIPPFFLVIEEAHNYCPERSFGEKKSSKILRTIASEGRKFGLGLCVISQRPARVDKSVVSQCSTQIILKVTNPNDLKAISSSVEGITNNTEAEIQELSIGTALVTGITDVPLFVKVRPRRSLHGGHAIDILGESNGDSFSDNTLSSSDEGSDIFAQSKEFEEQDIVPLIKPNTTPKDLMVMSDIPLSDIQNILRPAYMFTCEDKEGKFKLLVSREDGRIITDKEDFQLKSLPELHKLTKKELLVLHQAYVLNQFTSLDMVKAIGSNIDIVDDLKSLIDRNYVQEISPDHFKISDKYIFSTLNKFKVFDEINYEKIPYTQKVEATVDIDSIVENLQRFTSVLDHAEVYVLTYHCVPK
ncbi:ATP-binding protein [Candidatus Woesearchaeota archaeon]|nr:ATP-binding protein [Candidatus Woesearchaeota archaeon]